MSKVKEFVQIFKELNDELSSQGFSNLDLQIISPWVSTIFINQSNRGQATLAATTQDRETKYIEGEIESKGKKSVNGKDLFHVKIAGAFYNTFNKDAFGGRRFSEGEQVKAKVQKNAKGYWNLLELTPLDDDSPEDIDF